MFDRTQGKVLFLSLWLAVVILSLGCAKQPQPAEDPPAVTAPPTPECPVIESPPAFSATTEEPLLLRYLHRKGERYNVIFEANNRIEIQTHGQRMKTWMPIRITMQYKVFNVTREKIAELALRYQRVVIDLTYEGGNGQGGFTFDSAVDLDETNPAFKPFLSLVDTPLGLKISETGQIIHLEVKPLLKALGLKEADQDKPEVQEVLQRNRELFFNQFPLLPETPVKPGDTFPTGGYLTKLPTGSQLEFTAACRVKAIAADRRSGILEPIGKLSFILSPGGRKHSVSEDIFNGWLLFNVEKGYVERSAYSVCIKFYLGDGDEEETIRLNMKVSTTTEAMPGSEGKQ